MTNRVIPARVTLADGAGPALRRKMLRPDPREYAAEREDYIKTMYFRENAEFAGRLFGIFLHWTIVKPLQVVRFFMGVSAFLLLRPLMTLTIVLTACSLYLLGFIAYIAILTFWV